MTARTMLLCSAIFGATGVALGAFGAHGLKKIVEPELLQVWETAARYHMYHALALLGLGLIADRYPGGAVSAAGFLFVVGVVIFSGTLYAMTLTGARWLGAITPLGGVCLIGGWIAFAFAVASRR